MSSIAFIDTEIDPKNKKILDIGCINSDTLMFHSASPADFVRYIKNAEFICGHNIINHDLKYIGEYIREAGIKTSYIIDTLFLSPLLFPVKPYHALVKDDKLQTDELNNPLNDAIKAKDLFYDEVTAFFNMDGTLRQILYLLLKDCPGFSGFFLYTQFSCGNINPESLIREKFASKICAHAELSKIIAEFPVELAYCLALINTSDRYSITPPWVIKSYPNVEKIMYLLRNNPCLSGCPYCNDALDIHKGLKRFFGFDSYRTYAGEPLQEKAVRAAVNHKSLLAIFPTGGGKSITFQVPALMSGLNEKGLTVVISPLQSLMKDQVDNLEKVGITDAVTINGLLDPIERAKSIERVASGAASLLYISPESLRSRTIEHLLLGRHIARFVIDEAHCFSSWGQDFRVDYLYIGDFIKQLQEKKNLAYGIPVSCFTATAKQNVINDICQYFKDKLSIELEIFRSSASRTNLHYSVIERQTEEEKYITLRNLLEEKDCPTIVYVSRTKKAYDLAQRLSKDGYPAKPYHGKMDKQEKTENQNAFMSGEVRIMVATSAFGMGVDKKNVGMVIHYEISDSLENYVQEAGRAGRDESISADCYVLYNDEDLSKHFMLLNQTKLSIQEIKQVWKAIKDMTKFRSTISQSALEIARKAGWDTNISEIETRVKSAIAALEEAGYIKRGQNMPRIFADSIMVRTAQEASRIIWKSSRFSNDKEKQQASRIMSRLFSCKSIKNVKDQEAESRVDYLSDHLGMEKHEVIRIINILREERILADTKDLTAFIKKREKYSLNILKTFMEIEKFLLAFIQQEDKTYNIKELNEHAELAGCTNVSPARMKTVLNFLAIKNYIKQTSNYTNNHIAIRGLYPLEVLQTKLARRYEMSRFILEYLYEKIKWDKSYEDLNLEEILTDFSVVELKEAFDNRITLEQVRTSCDEIEDCLFYLSRIEALKLEGGFMVTYNALSISRLEQDNKKQYKKEDYEKLHNFYENRIQGIHIVGEYARKMISNYKEALQFVDDYFQLNYSSFLNKYFKGARQNEIARNITPAKFRQLFGELSPTQLNIINDRNSKYIVVAAGPGSGKTRILVHKLASLMLMEDVKHDQLLMLTFSRSAATEFKKRLLRLIGNAANFIEIKTFHSYCFDLLGRVGNAEKSKDVIRQAVEKIHNGEVEPGRITKTVLVIDEAQDMDENEFALICALMEHNEDMRVIAVGDDDQNIYEFRGSSSKYLEQLITEKKAVIYEMLENYRSKSNLVDFSNQFLKRIHHRLKQSPIFAVQRNLGRIRLFTYAGQNLITPLVNDILSSALAGSTCVLTKSNYEALQITGLLLNHGLPAKLIQSNDEFNLIHLLEVRYFLEQLYTSEAASIISDENWDDAKRNLINRFGKNTNTVLCNSIIKEFESANPRYKYKSDLEIFIRESRMEDFFEDKADAIIVSTMHKAKGREFDNVYLLLDQFVPADDASNRLLYVALTRAKNNLNIHTNGNYFNYIKTAALERLYIKGDYPPPSQITIQLTHKDVWLDAFGQYQNTISGLNTDDPIYITDQGCVDSKGRSVLVFSKNFKTRIEQLGQKHYSPTSAQVRHIVYWKNEDSKKEIKIVLPELRFELY